MFDIERLKRKYAESVVEPSNYSYGHLDRARWNVLDILNHLSKKAQPAYLFDEFDVAESDQLASDLSALGQKVTITAILLKAISIAQLSHPATATFRTPLGQTVERRTPVAGFTIERVVDGSPAVFFGVIHNAQNKSLQAIAREIQAYAVNDVQSVTQLYKENLMSKLPWWLRQLSVLISSNVPCARNLINPSTFGLTSLGKFGLANVVAPNVTPVIFGIGSMEEKPTVIDGKIEIRKRLNVSISVDTNAVGVTQANGLMQAVKRLIETALAGHMHADDVLPVSKNETPATLPAAKKKLRLQRSA